MGAIVKELKEKIVAAGGDVTGVQTVSEALDKMPAGGGSGGIFMIGFTYDESNNQLTSDKTAREIINAAEAGMMVFGKWKYESQYDGSVFYIYLLISYSDTKVSFRELTYSGHMDGYYENLDDYLVVDLGD